MQNREKRCSFPEAPEASVKWQYQLRRHWGCVSSYPGTGVQGEEYRFLFVHADGMQLEKITRMVEREKIVPQIDSQKFDLMQINDAVRLVQEGHTSGKVIIRFP